jgi:hypothetical protein
MATELFDEIHNHFEKRSKTPLYEYSENLVDICGKDGHIYFAAKVILQETLSQVEQRSKFLLKIANGKYTSQSG